jgi:quaternary ammonium compound-resistance protein SugE
MAWLFIAVAGTFEVVWAIGLKYTEGFTRLWPSVVTGVAVILSMFFLAQGVRTLPIGTAYAVWTGIGAAGTAILGVILFGESKDLARLGSILLIIAGIVGLRLTSGE